MNQDLVYQNREMGDLNPLAPTENSNPPESISPPQKLTNPKIKLLVLLAIFITIIFIISFIFSLLKRTPTPTPADEQIAVPTLNIFPTDIPNIAIPTEFRDQFDQIDRNNKINVDFTPPQIDPNIGQ